MLKTKELVKEAERELRSSGELGEETKVDAKTTKRIVDEIFRAIGTKLSEGEINASSILQFVEKAANN